MPYVYWNAVALCALVLVVAALPNLILWLADRWLWRDR